ncbi:MAG: hypothetical protein ACKOEC_15620 [Acidimicrobiia bacterium]
MAPFSIDLAVLDRREILPWDETQDKDAISRALALALGRLSDAGHAGKAGRFEDRVAALGDAMTALHEILIDPSLSGADEKQRSVLREFLRVMPLLLHANLSVSPIPLQLAIDALKTTRDLWSMDNAAVDAS